MYNSTIEKSIRIDGTETLMFLEFCEKFNCTLEAVIGLSLNNLFKNFLRTRNAIIEFYLKEKSWIVLYSSANIKIDWKFMTKSMGIISRCLCSEL